MSLVFIYVNEKCNGNVLAVPVGQPWTTGATASAAICCKRTVLAQLLLRHFLRFRKWRTHVHAHLHCYITAVLQQISMTTADPPAHTSYVKCNQMNPVFLTPQPAVALVCFLKCPRSDRAVAAESNKPTREMAAGSCDLPWLRIFYYFCILSEPKTTCLLEAGLIRIITPS